MIAAIVAAMLLVIPSVASAECAWVLWERVSDPRFGGDGIYWDILRAYDNHGDCVADFKKLMSPNSAWHANHEALTDDSVIMRSARRRSGGSGGSMRRGARDGGGVRQEAT